MGIPIYSMFGYNEILRDIIFTNFFYYYICEKHFNELEVIKERCRYLFAKRITYNLQDDIWENIWEDVVKKLQKNDNDFLFI